MDFLNPKPFTPYKLEEERKKDKGRTFTVWMSEEEYKQLQRDMDFINEPKPSTALKQLAKMGSNLLGTPSVACVINTLFINKRKRER